MRARSIIKAISPAAAFLLLTWGAVSAQDEEPALTPPPNQFVDVQTGVIRNETTEPSINATVEDAARFAHLEIGGKVGGRNDGLRLVTVPAAPKVVLAARDLAEEAFDLIVMSGGDSQGSVGFASAYPNTTFLDIDQSLPCVTLDGRADPSGTCEGGEDVIPSNYSAVSFEVDQGAYLAGVIAAAASRDDSLGIISGTTNCAECNRYIQGFTLGAQSVKPDIGVQVAYLADDSGETAFGDPVSAKTFAKAFIDVYEPDVVLPLAGSGSRGIIEAACEAGILAVGTNIDVSTVYPELAECILTSVTKDIEFAVREAIFAFANQSLTKDWRLGLDDGRVAVTDEWTRLPGLPVDLSERYSLAEQAILTGQVDTCPTACGAPLGPVEPEEPEEPAEPEEVEASPLP